MTLAILSEKAQLIAAALAHLTLEELEKVEEFIGIKKPSSGVPEELPESEKEEAQHQEMEEAAGDKK